MEKSNLEETIYKKVRDYRGSDDYFAKRVTSLILAVTRNEAEADILVSEICKRISFNVEEKCDGYHSHSQIYKTTEISTDEALSLAENTN